jgi:aminoglycoside 6'-N-acetyltransferase
VIRALTDDDVGPVLAILQEPEVARWWGTHDEAWLRAAIAESTFTWVVDVDGEPGGYIQVWEENDPDWRWVDIDIFLSARFHGRGIGPDAIRDALRYCFEERGHHRATLSTAVDNERAIKVYEKLGFRRVGILRKSSRMDGEWKDEVFMELLAAEMT